MKLLSVILALLLLLAPVTSHAEFWGSTKAKVYHKRSCRFVSKTTPEYRVTFADRKAAWDAGYRPCQVCRPPGFDAVPGKKIRGGEHGSGTQR